MSRHQRALQSDNDISCSLLHLDLLVTHHREEGTRQKVEDMSLLEDVEVGSFPQAIFQQPQQPHLFSFALCGVAVEEFEEFRDIGRVDAWFQQKKFVDWPVHWCVWKETQKDFLAISKCNNEMKKGHFISTVRSFVTTVE